MRTASALLTWLALVPTLSQAQDRTAIQSGLADLIPSNAFFVVRGTSLDALQDTLAELMKDIDPGEEVPDLTEDMPLDPNLLARDQPIALAASFENGQPAVTFIFPTNDPQAALASLPTQNGMAAPRTAGKYVGMTQGSTYEVGGGSFLQGMQPGMVSMRLDFAPVLETFAPFIEMGMEQFQMGMEQGMAEISGPFDTEAMIDLYVDGFEAFMDSAQVLDIALDFQQGQLIALSSLSVATGSPLAGFGSDVPSDFASLAKRLGGANNMGTFLVGFDYSDYEEAFGPMMESLLSIYPADIRKNMGLLMETWVKMFKECTPNVGGQFRMHAGMQASFVVEAKENATPLVPQVQDMFMNSDMESMGYKFGPMEKQDIFGVKGFLGKMSIDMNTVMEQLGEGVIAEADAEEMQKVLANLYGGDSMDFWVGAYNKHLIYTMGGNDSVRAAAVNAVKSANSRQGSGLEWAIEMVANRTPSMAYEFDLGAAIQQMLPLVQAIEPGAGELPEGMPQSVPVSTYMVVEDQRWLSGGRVEWKAMAEMMRALD